MKVFLKTMHFIAVTIFLGSIVTYIFLGALVPEGNSAAMTMNRQWIEAATLWLTLPSMWVAGVSGILMAGRPKDHWLWIKFAGFTLIALNAHVFVYPAIQLSLETVHTADQLFEQALVQEAMFGALNVLLILVLIVVAIKKPFRAKTLNH